MSELDQLYQEFYAQVTAKIWADYEAFKKAKTDLFPEALIEAFQKRLLDTGIDFSSSYEDPDINKTNYLVTQSNRFRETLVERFRYDKKKTYKYNSVYNFLEEKLKKIAQEKRYSFAVPSKETLAKTFAFYDAYIDVFEQLKAELDKENSFPIMTVKQTLRKWLADGENERVVDALQTIANQFGDTYFINDVTHQAGRYSSLKKKEQLNTIDERDAGIELAKIRRALLDLIDKIPANATLPHVDTADSAAPTPPGDTGDVPPTTQPGPPTPKLPESQPLSSTRYIWISAIGLLLTVGLFIVMTYFGSQLNATQNDRAYYILLFFLGIGVAAFLFGAMRTYATWNGKVFNGNLEIGGPIVLAAAVVIGGFVLPKNNEGNFTFRVVVHGKGNIYEKILRDQGEVVVDFDKPEREKINNNGEAVFTQISKLQEGEKVRIYIEHPQPYQVTHPDSLYKISENGKIYVEAALLNADRLFGTITDASNNEFLDSVRVNIQNVATYTDKNGWFELKIPADIQQKFQRVTLAKKGYETITFDSIPVHTQKEFSYALSRKKK